MRLIGPAIVVYFAALALPLSASLTPLAKLSSEKHGEILRLPFFSKSSLERYLRHCIRDLQARKEDVPCFQEAMHHLNGLYTATTAPSSSETLAKPLFATPSSNRFCTVCDLTASFSRHFLFNLHPPECLRTAFTQLKQSSDRPRACDVCGHQVKLGRCH